MKMAFSPYKHLYTLDGCDVWVRFVGEVDQRRCAIHPYWYVSKLMRFSAAVKVCAVAGPG